jgi:uncharacterized protein (TIGR03435 family)
MHMQLSARNVTMGYLGQSLAGTGNAPSPVVDQTGLAGTYDFMFEVGGAGIAAIANTAQPGTSATDPQGPTFPEAIRDQLGLKLVSIKGPIQILVIDHVEKLSEN